MKLNRILNKLAFEDKNYSSNENKEFNVELVFVGPKSKNQNRKHGAYILPHNLQTINTDLLDNPEYYDRCVVYDLTHDQAGHTVLQKLKSTFKKFEVTHAELTINYTVNHTHEAQDATHGGEKLTNVPPHIVDDIDAEVNDVHLLLYNEKGARIKELKVPAHYAYDLFDIYEEQILND
tara:strand:+ start:545 stop:1078 length:534 start_codon:yes stop_codon:yes gene_type:complete